MRNWAKLTLALTLLLVIQVVYVQLQLSKSSILPKVPIIYLDPNEEGASGSQNNFTNPVKSKVIRDDSLFMEFVLDELHQQFPQFPIDFNWSSIPKQGCSNANLGSRKSFRSIARNSTMYNLKEQANFSVDSHPDFAMMMPFYRCNYTKVDGFVMPLRNPLIYSVHPEIMDCNSNSLIRPFGCRQHIDLPNRMQVANPKSIVRLDGEVVVITGFFAQYYHFVVEELPRLAMVHRYLIKNPEVRILVNMDPLAEQFALLFGLDFSRFIDTRPDVLYSIEKAIVPMGIRCGFPNSGMLMYTREILLWRFQNLSKKAESDSSKVMVLHKRKPGRERSVLNHDYLVEALRQAFPDYTLIESFHDDSLEKNVENHINADVVIGPHGANMVNMLFCKPNVKILEIHPRHGNTEDIINFVYVRMAESLGLHLNWTRSTSGSASSSFSVNVPDVIDLVSELLS